ncbi:MAG: glycosyltransferase family 4 protein [Patescibacteria group bacterium]
MRIAHIVSTYPPYYGGMGNVVFQTASELTKLGHEVEVFTPGNYEEKEIKKTIEPAEAEHAPDLQEKIDFARRLKPSLQYGNAARIPSIEKELKGFDIVHLHYPFFGTAGMIKRWKMKNPYIPLAITYHMDTRAPGWKGLIFKYYSKYWMPKILNSADVLLVSSFDYLPASDANLIYQNNPKKWIELPFGVDTERFKPRSKPEAIFKRFGLDPQARTIVFVGGMDLAHYFKGIPVLLRALGALKAQNRPIQAVFVGDGQLRASFENKALFYGLSRLVKFAGQVSDEELPYYYNLGDLCVLPSINQGEAFGMVLLEAMASGVPVLATDLPGVRTVAEDGGLVVPANDYQALAQGIAQYFFSDTDREVLKQKARQAAEEKYDWGVVVKRLEEVYQELVG